jgi:chromosome partitioning protein
MRRIAVQNLKGGTAKTTTAVSLAHGLALRGKKVLLLDADVQGNVAACLGIKKPEAGLYQLLISDLTIGNCVVPSGRENLDILPSDRSLAVAEVQLQGMPRREEILSLRLRMLSGYDYVIVDCGPTLSLLHQNVLLFADELLVPISTEYLAMLGAQQILESMKFLRRYFERAPRLLGVLPTLFDARTNIANEISQAITEAYRGICPVLPPIPLDTRMSQAMAKKKTIFEHAPVSRAADAYTRLARWIDKQDAIAEVLHA